MGQTVSQLFPIVDAFQAGNRGLDDAFIVKLNADASRLLYSSYLGGSRSDGSPSTGYDTATGIVLDGAGNAYVAGYTLSFDLPTTSDAFQATLRGGVCDYFDEPTHLCGVHRDHGEAMLPASCRHFPRRALIDDRGVFVTLSHYCPTAAGGLFDDTPLTIVANPPAFPHGRDYDGWAAPSLLAAVRDEPRERFNRIVLEGEILRGMPAYSS